MKQNPKIMNINQLKIDVKLCVIDKKIKWRLMKVIEW